MRSFSTASIKVNLTGAAVMILSVAAIHYFDGLNGRGWAASSQYKVALSDQTGEEDELVTLDFDEVDLRSLTMLRTSTN